MHHQVDGVELLDMTDLRAGGVTAIQVLLGLYPVVTSQHRSTTVYQVSYRSRSLLFESGDRISP